jgi:hypothetical protein
MSFIEPRSEISICNKALSKVKQQGLQGSLDDAANPNKHAGRECKLWYKTIVRQVLSMHHWGLAVKRVALTSAAVNDRSLEWMNAYLAPTDMAFPMLIGPYSSGVTVSYYRGLGYLLGQLTGQPMFRYEGNLIYAQLDGATLDYTSFDITEQDLNDAVEKVIVLFLAAQLARSISKDDKLAKELHEEGVSAVNLEIAHNLNIGGQRYGYGWSESDMVRQGYDPVLAGYGLPI